MEVQTFFVVVIFFLCLVVASKLIFKPHGTATQEHAELSKLVTSIRAGKEKINLAEDALEQLDLHKGRERDIKRLLEIVERTQINFYKSGYSADVIEFPSVSDRKVR